MCLTIEIEKPESIIDREEVKAFKFFVRKGDELYYPLLGHNKPVPTNQWLEEKSQRASEMEERCFTSLFENVIPFGFSREGASYPKGFHAYLTKEDAEKNIDQSWNFKENFRPYNHLNIVIKEVLLKDIVVVGEQINNYNPVIVAKKMKVLCA